MMAAIDRLDEAAHMLGYLETINDFGALASRTLVSQAARKVAAHTMTMKNPPSRPGTASTTAARSRTCAIS
jgi:hypothetical protein